MVIDVVATSLVIVHRFLNAEEGGNSHGSPSPSAASVSNRAGFGNAFK